MSQSLGLIVDDDPCVNEMLSDGLTHYQFKYAPSFVCGESMIKSDIKFDFIILDYRLGRKCGLDLVKLLRKHQRYAPVILISAYGSTTILKDIIESKIDTFVDKPLNFEYLDKKIKSVLLKEGTDQSLSYDAHITNIQKRQNHSKKEGVILKDYAKKHHLNYKYLCQKYKKQCGTSYRQKKGSQRYDIGKQLLKETDQTVDTIARQLGFLNPASFMKGFKKRFGITPSQWRSANKLENCG